MPPLLDVDKQWVHLKNVPVLENKYLGVEPYIIEDLIFVNMLYTDTFFDEMFPHDPRIKDMIHQEWPHFPVCNKLYIHFMCCCLRFMF